MCPLLWPRPGWSRHAQLQLRARRKIPPPSGGGGRDAHQLGAEREVHAVGCGGGQFLHNVMLVTASTRAKETDTQNPAVKNWPGEW